MLPLARRHGAVFAPTEVISATGQSLMTMAANQRQFCYADLGIWPGSFRLLLRRELSPSFRDGAAQDIMHAIEVLGKLGGLAPLAVGTSYHLNLRQGSIITDQAYAWRVGRQYQQMIRMISAGKTDLCRPDRARAIAALEARRHWNRRWCSSPGHRDGFYGYVASEIK
jgi:hypothetical protein